ncbi:o-acetyltransferase CAS1 [Fusarium pseudoanthophilum]|uniref:O-acetyltransferase CAS1 n=1 Tax=Fusarium pseudoanthophilum TaxID=48495 RepID=A0A8H5P6B0_9HYPO|nr:o-acetyltransferase CAS1 [Fusarium pseudoanthophilum]
MNKSWSRLIPVVFASIFLVLVAFKSLFPGDDPYRCRAVQKTGRWIDPIRDEHGNRDPFKQWQPDGCILNHYDSQDIRRCTEGRPIVIVGDSTSKNLGLAMASLLDNKQYKKDEAAELFSKTTSFNMTYHGQRIERVANVYISSHGVPGREQFVSHLETYAEEKTEIPTIEDQKGPALIYIAAGAWYTHPHYGGIGSTALDPWDDRFSAYQDHLSKVDKFIGDNTPREDWFSSPMDPRDGIGNQIFYAPPAGPRYLGNDTKMVIDRGRRAEEVIEMQNWLLEKEDDFNIPFIWSIANLVEGQDKVWRDPLRTGFHVKFHVAELRANILLNMRCNAKLDRMKPYPYSRTCCTDYGVKPMVQLSVVAFGIVYLAACIVCEILDMCADRSADQPRFKALNMQAGCFVLALLMCYYADRTQMMAKGSKLWQLKDFIALCIACIAIMLATIRRIKSHVPEDLSVDMQDSGQPFLSRDQTDEWKGWIQVLILIYHWTGAHGGSIYVLIRVCVAAYLFQAGYGQTLYFLNKNDFSFNRVAATLLRLNMLSCCLAYFMDTDYMFYYFPSLLSFWFLVVYATMAIRPRYNGDLQVMLAKICMSCLILSVIFMGPSLTRWVFEILSTVFKIQWSYKEWHRRVTLDMLIVYVGMLTAVVNRHLKKPVHLGLRVALALACFFATTHYFYATSGLRMAAYSKWHPYVSLVPVVGFVAMRNVSGPVRNYHSKAMAWLGRCSLEIYILQFHILLAADTEGVLVVDGLFGDGSLMGDRWRTLVIILPIFLWISHSVAGSTGYIVKTIMHQGTEDEKLGRPSFWAFPEKIPVFSGLSAPKIRVICILLVMWLLNLMSPGHEIPSYPTQALELETLSLTHEAGATPKQPNPVLSTTGRRLGSRNDHEDEHDNFTGSGDEAAPPRATLVVEKWNEPIGNAFRVGAVYWSLFVSGANDAAYGALIPYLETYYELSYLVVSLIFLSPFVGFIVSAAVNNYLHMNIGQRWIAFMCGGCHALTYLILSQHPPYPVLVLAYVLAGLGNGIGLAAWNSYIGNLARSNELLGFMHASYGLGGTVSPLIATSMITQANLGWYDFYYVLLGMAVLETATLTYSFWPKTAQKYREAVHTEGTRNEGTRAALFVKPHARVVWLCAFFLLGYVGAEVALGGWVVQFMLRVRNADPFDAGMTAVGFWLGITVGRLVLGMVIPKIGVKLSLMIFIPITMGLQLIFWLVPQFHVSAVAVSLQGFFLGPMFPCVIVALTKLLPRHLHVSAIGFAAAFGGSGAAVLPFAVGAIAQAKGVQVLQPIILAILAVLFVIWLGLPKIEKRKD